MLRPLFFLLLCFPAIAHLLENKTILFVPGLLNELSGNIPGGYFADNMDIVEELGGQTRYFGPSSIKSIPENAAVLYEHILKTSEPLILFGHSKGAAEILYMILQHPELISEALVESVILIQALIGGTPLADEPSDWLCYDIWKYFLLIDLKDFGQYRMMELFEAAFKNFEVKTSSEQKKILNQRIFYVRSQQADDNHAYPMHLARKFVRRTSELKEANDGFLPISAQMDARIGIDLGVVQADHASLVLGWIGSLSRLDRKAFTRALFKMVFTRF